MDENLKKAKELQDQMKKQVESKKFDIMTDLLVIIFQLILAYSIFSNIRTIQIICGIILILEIIIDAMILKKKIDQYQWMEKLYNDVDGLHKLIVKILNCNELDKDTKDETH